MALLIIKYFLTALLAGGVIIWGFMVLLANGMADSNKAGWLYVLIPFSVTALILAAMWS